jgi:hypothetical protein
VPETVAIPFFFNRGLVIIEVGLAAAAQHEIQVFEPGRLHIGVDAAPAHRAPEPARGALHQLSQRLNLPCFGFQFTAPAPGLKEVLYVQYIIHGDIFLRPVDKIFQT